MLEINITILWTLTIISVNWNFYYCIFCSIFYSLSVLFSNVSGQNKNRRKADKKRKWLQNLTNYKRCRKAKGIRSFEIPKSIPLGSNFQIASFHFIYFPSIMLILVFDHSSLLNISVKCEDKILLSVLKNNFLRFWNNYLKLDMPWILDILFKINTIIPKCSCSLTLGLL